MSRILAQFEPELDVEELSVADAVKIATQAKVDIGKVEKLQAAWAADPKPSWAVELIAQALSGYMFVAGVWRIPTVVEAEQAGEAAKAKSAEAARYNEYAAAMAVAAEQGEITRRYERDPAKFLADRRNREAASRNREAQDRPPEGTAKPEESAAGGELAAGEGEKSASWATDSPLGARPVENSSSGTPTPGSPAVGSSGDAGTPPDLQSNLERPPGGFFNPPDDPTPGDPEAENAARKAAGGDIEKV